MHIKSVINTAFFIIFILFSYLLSGCSQKPDVIYTNGKIYTLDKSNSVAEAVAVKEGKLIAVGTSKEITDKYKCDNIVDLNGKTVIPGFIDSEGSLIEFSRNLNFVNLLNVKSIAEIKKLIADRVKETKEGTWIGGYGWSELNIPENELEIIDRKILDEIAPKHNVYLINLTANTVWTNTKLLETLQISALTPAPPNGEIEKDAKGELTGLFFDDAVNLIKEKLPTPSREQMAVDVEKGANELLKYGITAVKDRSVGKDGITLLKELIDKNKLPVFVYAVLTGTDESFGDYLKSGVEENYKGKLSVRAVSLDIDGAFSLQEAYMKDDYSNEPKRKEPYINDSILDSICKIALSKNFQVNIKAVGDKAVNTALNILGKNIRDSKINNHRSVIEHIQFIEPSDIPKFKEYGIIPSVRPEISVEDMEFIKYKVKPENIKNTALWSSLVKSAGLIVSGSDFPFHQINPLFQIYFLNTRQTVDSTISESAGTEQKLSVLDALKSYTLWAAYGTFMEESRGSIENGKFADMVVLSDDIMNIPAKKIFETKVLKTIISGKIVFEKK